LKNDSSRLSFLAMPLSENLDNGPALPSVFLRGLAQKSGAARMVFLHVSSQGDGKWL
jgi:hypothetical protein